MNGAFAAPRLILSVHSVPMQHAKIALNLFLANPVGMVVANVCRKIKDVNPAFTGFRCGGELIERVRLRSRLGERIAGDGPHVLGALEGAGRGTILLAQAALELRDGFVFVLLHPRDEVALNHAELRDAVAQQHGAEHCHVRAGHEHLQHVGGAVDAASGGETGAEASVQNRYPSQGHPHRHGRAQQNVRLHLERFEVNVRLVKAVEQHEAVRAGGVELARHGGEVGEERAQLDRDGNRDFLFHRLENVQISLLHVSPGQIHVGGDAINIQLQRIGAGLLDLFRIGRPAAGGRAVQAGDDGDAHRFFRLGDVFEIFLRAEVEGFRLREIGQRLGETFRALHHALVQFGPVLAQLLLEQRVKHHGGRAGVLHFFDVVNVLRERRRGGHQRRAEFQSEISGRQVHDIYDL